MKQGRLADEQKLFINGTQISGVQSVEGSYGIQEKPINILGWGLVGADYYPPEPKFKIESKHDDTCFGFVIQEEGIFNPNSDGFFDIMQEDVYSCSEDKPRHCPDPQSMAVLNSPIEGSFTINSTLVSEDFFLPLLGDIGFTGSLHYPCHGYFGFSSGYISNHTVSCQVGQIPSTSTNIRVFGDVGGSPEFLEQETRCIIMDEFGYAVLIEDSFHNDPPYQYNAKGDNDFPEIRIPDQGSISIECAGAETDRVVAFNHSIDVPIDPIYVVGSPYAVQVDVVWPIVTTTSFTLEIDEYKYQSLRKYLRKPTVHDIAIKINDCFGDPIQHYTIKQARLIAESMSTSVDGRLTANLEYKSYYNKRGIIPHSNDFTTSNFKSAMWSPGLLSPALWHDALDKNYLNLDGYSVMGWKSKGPSKIELTSQNNSANPRYTQYIFNKKPAINFFGQSSLGTKELKINRDKPFYIFIAGQFKDKDKSCMIVDTLATDFSDEFDRLIIERLGRNNIKVSTQTRGENKLLVETGKVESKGDDIVDGVLDPSYKSDQRSVETIKIETFILTVFVNGEKSYLDINGRAALINGNLGSAQIDGFTLGSVRSDLESTMNGFIAESIIIEELLVDGDIFKVQGYLAHKWGFDNLLPENHLYKHYMPVL